MKHLEVFFDYACPYCLRAHEYLEELVRTRPAVDVIWRPCEAHPRPDRYGPHSDLCIQGFFFAVEHGVELWEYHKTMYRAALQEKVDIEDARVLADYAGGILDSQALLRALQQGRYQQIQQNANQYAFERSGVWAVPSYRMGGKKLDSIEDVGVSRDQLASFLDEE